MELPVQTPYQLLWAKECGGSVISVACTPSCGRIVAGAVDRFLYMFDGDGNPRTKKELDDEVWAVAISRDGRRVAAGTASKKPAKGTLFIFDGLGEELGNFQLGAPIWGVATSYQGNKILAGTWSGYLYLFEETEYGYERTKVSERLTEHGIYGVAFLPDGNGVLASAYNLGVCLLDNDLKLVQTLGEKNGYYNLAVASDSKVIYAGMRDGRILKVPSLSSSSPWILGDFSPRPICGISATQDGRLLALGSFDGKVILISESGAPLWTFEAMGEIWSTAISSTGKLICAGSGDNHVYLIRSCFGVSELQEIHELERSLAEREPPIEEVDNLCRLYVKYGLLEYGSQRLLQLLPKYSDLRGRLYNRITAFLANALGGSDYSGHFLLAQIYEKEKYWKQAANHFVTASRNSELRSDALVHAGMCFKRLARLQIEYMVLRG